jgi:hypothetical protein
MKHESLIASHHKTGETGLDENKDKTEEKKYT